VFVEPFGGWNPETGQTAELAASDGVTGDFLGATLAASGDSVLAGAPLHQIGANADQGDAYLFTKTGETWTNTRQTEELTASDGALGDFFGLTVGLSGDLAVVGALPKIGDNLGQGATYLYDAPPTVAIASPANGATYTQNHVIPASFSCTAPDGAMITACAAPTPDGTPIDTSTLGQHSFTVTATDSDGVAATQTATYTVIPPQPAGAGTTGPPTNTKPRLSITAVRESASIWRVGSSQPRIARRRPPIGTTFSFVLSDAARVTLSFAQLAPGRSVHGTCAAPSVKDERQPRCTRSTATGALTLSGHGGLNRVRFEGRLARNKTLRPGRYRMVITANTRAGQRTNSGPLHFTVAR
jgi:FG-GAP repeat